MTRADLRNEILAMLLERLAADGFTPLGNHAFDSRADYREAQARVSKSILDGRFDYLASVQRVLSVPARRQLQHLLDLYIDSRTLHDADGPRDWHLFAIPCCVFSGSMPLSLSMRIDEAQRSATHLAMLRARVFSTKAKVVLHDGFIPLVNLERLSVAERLLLVAQVHGRRAPLGLARAPLVQTGLQSAPYMLIGVASERIEEARPVHKPDRYEDQMERALAPSFSHVAHRRAECSRPLSFTRAMRAAIPEFMGQVVRTGLALGARDMRLVAIGLDDNSSDKTLVRMHMQGHPAVTGPFTFDVPTHERETTLSGLRAELSDLPVKLTIPV